jgi:hypothetical protein
VRRHQEPIVELAALRGEAAKAGTAAAGAAAALAARGATTAEGDAREEWGQLGAAASAPAEGSAHAPRALPAPDDGQRLRGGSCNSNSGAA